MRERAADEVRWYDYFPMVGPVRYVLRNRKSDINDENVQRGIDRIMPLTNVSCVLAGASLGLYPFVETLIKKLS